MNQVITYALLGFGIGSLYALCAQGLVLIYRGSGVLNFAQGGIGALAAYLEWVTFHQKMGLPFAPAFIAAVAIAGLIGAATHLLIMRPLRSASPLARIVATLGLLAACQGAVQVAYGTDPVFPKSILPQSLLHVSGVEVPVDRFILFAIAAVLSFALWWLYRSTTFGMATTAVAHNQRAASALGWSPDLIATANWALGSALAGGAAILVAPIVQLQITTMTQLVLAAMAAALVAGFYSFPIALWAGMGIGIAQTLLHRYVAEHSWGTGFDTAVPFVVIVVYLIFAGQAIPLRDFFLQRLPTVGSGKLRWGWIAVGIIVTLFLIANTDVSWSTAFTNQFAGGLVLLSIVVLTGYAGQLSLAQYAIAGVGALIAGRLVAAQDWPLWASTIVAMFGAGVLGVLFALPAIRTRGINLAIVTLGLGSAIELVVFNNGKYTGGFYGTDVGVPDLFGWSIDPIAHAQRYAIVCFAAFLLVALAVANIRRSRSGRRLLAVRTNERAAAALGISVTGAKMYAFAVAGAIAALGGILIGFQESNILYSTSYSNFNSVLSVGYAFAGGVGYILGPLFGGTLLPGGLGTQIGNQINIPSVQEYLTLFGGAFVIVVVLQNQDGMAHQSIVQKNWVGVRLRRLLHLDNVRLPTLTVLSRRRPSVLAQNAKVEIRKVEGKVLEVENVTLRYGQVVAVNDVSMTIRPGEIVGLIGPNGAGKTSFIDAVTGFSRPSAGTVKLGGQSVAGLGVTARSRAGLGRSFQSLELFEDLTVLDNLRAACDPRDVLSYARDPFYPVDAALPAEVVAAIRDFSLEDDLDRKVQDLPYGQRRLVALARAVATTPSVLMLDEPVAGLSNTESLELVNLVRRLASEWGMGIMVIEHDMGFVMNVCDRIVVLDFGNKIAEGTPDEIRNNPDVIKAYLGTGSDEPATATAAVPVADVRS